MKIGIITFHRALNFGAILQTYALQRTIKDLGFECETIDYRSDKVEANHRPISLKKLIHIRSFLFSVINNRVEFINKKKFRTFLKKNITLSSRMFKNDYDFSDQYSCVITGSDQVWNYIVTGDENTFLLDFVGESTLKCSYAASFGVENIPDAHVDRYAKLLSKIDMISVREKSGVKLVDQLINKTPELVLDPTLLINKDEWFKLSHSNTKTQQYILIYVIVESETLFNFAKELSQTTGLELVYINDKIKAQKGIKNIRNAGPSEWLDLFYNASYIVTNSFHGTAFSINFNKEFYVEMLPKPAKVNSRIVDILKMFNLEDRKIENDKPIDASRKIDYSEVNKILTKERKNSISFLTSMLSNVKGESK